MTITRGILIGLGSLAVLASSASAQVHDRRLLDRWLFCIECVNGELDSVRAEGSRHPEPTTSRFAALLLAGPPASLRAANRAYLHQLFTTDSVYARTDSLAPVVMERAEFVSMYSEGFDVAVRRRAALALGAIGGPRARAALDSALGRSEPAGVAPAVQFAIDSLWHP